MPEIMEWIQFGLILLTLAAAITIPILMQRRLLGRAKSEVSKFTSKVDQSIASAVKLLEVREYYGETVGQLRKMLDEAYKDGNRVRQEQIKKLLDRLETLKVRAVDKTVSVLEPDAQGSKTNRKRRRRPRRRKPRNGNRPADAAPGNAKPG